MSFRTSKCQMRKFTTGGRCSGDIPCQTKEDSQGVSSAYTAMLQAREQQMKQWDLSKETIEQTETKKENQQIVIKENTKKSKEECIDIILNGDIN